MNTNLKEAINKIDFSNLKFTNIKNTNFDTSLKEAYVFYKKDKNTPIAFIGINENNNLFLKFIDNRGIKSFYNYLKKDRDFMKIWETRKQNLLKAQFNRCISCGEYFNETKNSFLHHKINWKGKQKETERKVEKEVLKSKLSILEGFNKIEKTEYKMLNNYKSLKDTILICKKCHFLEHLENPFR